MAAISQEDAAVIARITEPEALRMAVAPDGSQETKTGGGGGGKLVVVTTNGWTALFFVDHYWLDYFVLC